MSCAMSIVRTIRILGIDPGLRVTGFGVIDKAGQKLAYVTSGCVKTKDSDSLPDRVKTLLEGIAEVIATHGPAEAAVEKEAEARSRAEAKARVLSFMGVDLLDQNLYLRVT